MPNNGFKPGSYVRGARETALPARDGEDLETHAATPCGGLEGLHGPEACDAREVGAADEGPVLLEQANFGAGRGRLTHRV